MSRWTSESCKTLLLVRYMQLLHSNVKSDVRLLIFGKNFLLLEGRKSIFLSASRSQFVAKGPATILKIGQRIRFLWPK